MKLMRIGPVGAERPVLLDGDEALDASSVATDFDRTWWTDGGPERLIAARSEGRLPRADIEGQRIGAPVARPGKVVCIGLNYRDHAAETGAAIPKEPIIFMKGPDTVIGPNDTVLIPRKSIKTDWEVELAVIMGSRARYLDLPSDAWSVIGGYAIANDVSEREFQLERGGQWDKGKSCETFNPLGPWLVTPDEIEDPHALRMGLSVNGETRQNGSTANMIFGVDHVIWYLSQFMVLEPGDVINTGTPAGVALGLPDHPYLRSGDVMELWIDGLGRQRQELGAA
jgi:2-keto-4-pentenoate hydratase/2-oxohepta-3-ene-1,7-dioic acid hydratase in catechol pathway